MAINLGNITFGLAANVQQLASAGQAVLTFGANVARTITYLNSFGKASQQATGAAQGLGAALNGINAGNTAAGLRQLSGVAVLVAGPLSGIATRLQTIAVLADRFSLAWAGAIAGVAAGAYTFLKFAQASIDVERQLQNISSTLTAVYGNTTIANLQMSYLADLSARTGVSFNVLAKQYSQVEAAAKGTTLEGERVQKVFEAIAFAGTKLGLSNEEVEGTFRAIQQMISKGTIQMEELKGQLGDRLPGALQIMAEALGVSVLKLDAMIKKGDVGTSSLTKFADVLLKRYNIDTSQKVDTITAAEGRLQTARVAAIDSLDKIVGVSTAYKNLIDGITNGLNGNSSSAREMVKQTIQVGVALAATFASPLIIGGISSITFGIARLAQGITTLNAVSALGAVKSFTRLLAAAAIAIGAYYGSEALIDKALGKTQESFLKAKPAVEDYIAAQQKLVTSVRGPTNDYIKQQEEVLKNQEAQREEILKQESVIEGWQDSMRKMGATQEQLDEQFTSMGGGELVNKYQAASQAIDKTKKSISDLQDILKRQTAEEDKARADPTKDLTTRQEVTIKKAQESIRDLKEKYSHLFDAPKAKEQADTQEEINHEIETFKENLERAEIPAEKMKKLVQDYSKALRDMKEGQLILKNQVSGFQALADVWGKGTNTALSNFVDVIVDGKDALLALEDTAKAVAKDILNTFLKLAALNPLKNFLFGTNEQVLGGNAGIGGALGGLLGGGSTSGVSYGGVNVPRAGIEFAMGGIMGPGGRVPMRSYAGGGVASSPQMAIYGEGSRKEAYVPLPDGRSIPVAMSGGGGGGMEVHIHESPGSKASVSKTQNANGRPQLHVEIRDMVRGVMNEDIANSGPMSRSMEKQYGLRRSAGLTS